MSYKTVSAVVPVSDNVFDLKKDIETILDTKINNATRKENPWDDTIFLSKITSDVVKTDVGIHIVYTLVFEKG